MAALGRPFSFSGPLPFRPRQRRRNRSRADRKTKCDCATQPGCNHDETRARYRRCRSKRERSWTRLLNALIHSFRTSPRSSGSSGHADGTTSGACRFLSAGGSWRHPDIPRMLSASSLQARRQVERQRQCRANSQVVVPSFPSLSWTPMAFSSSRIRSDSAQFLAARAARRSSIFC